MSVQVLGNRDYRRALLRHTGLAEPAEGCGLPRPEESRGAAWVDGILDRLGYVQVDTIPAVERAHHHILFSRNRHYRQDCLRQTIEDQRTSFEHWSHDASIIPMSLYGYWKHRFRRADERMAENERWQARLGEDPRATLKYVRERIEQEGPLMTRDFERTGRSGTGGMWDWHPAKTALETFWRNGVLAIHSRVNFHKVYDLSQRVIPDEYREAEFSEEEFIDWICRDALRRIGAGSPRQIAHYFGALSAKEAGTWCERNLGGDIVRVALEHADGALSPTPLYAIASFVEALKEMPPVPRGMTVLNPFDPLIHDRRRTEQIFGFDYTVEIFVPEKKRKYGYYVMPVLEGERFTGRVDAKADRKNDVLRVQGIWWEQGVKPTAARMDQLERRLAQLGKFAGVSGLEYSKGYMKT